MKLNVRARNIIILLKENMGEYLYDFSLGQDVLGQQILTTKGKLKELNGLKSKVSL